MTQGIRAEVKVEATACPISRSVRNSQSAASLLSRSVNPQSPDKMTEEFVVNSDQTPEDVGDEFEEIFDYGPETVYRFDRPLGYGCPCEVVEQFDCSVVDVDAWESELHLVFHAADTESLQNALRALQEKYTSVEIRRLLRSPADRSNPKPVVIDRGKLTGRQLEVLQTAHRMGYFDHPKEANAQTVAEELDIDPSTFTEHLSTAQTKLLDSILPASKTRD